MPQESTNLKLKLYNAITDAKESAIVWFNNIFNYSNSNWVKIDEAYGKINSSYIKDIEASGDKLIITKGDDAKEEIEGAIAKPATKTSLGTVQIGDNISVDTKGSISLEKDGVDGALGYEAAEKMNLVAITIPSTGWNTDDNTSYASYIDINATGIKPEDCVALVISPDSNLVAQKCFFAATEAMTGKIRIRVRNVPTEAIQAFYYVIREDILMGFGQTPIGGAILPPATKKELGGIIAGDGLSVTSGGVLTVDIATKALQDGDGNIIVSAYPQIQSNAGYHNSVYRGKDITDKFTSGTLFANISNGTFEDLFIGDYFTATCNGVDTKWRLAGFDIYCNCGDTALTRHHAVVIPDNALLRANMNATSTSVGGYKSSRMYTKTIPDLATKIGTMVGTSHLIQYRDILTMTIDMDIISGGHGAYRGASNHWEWTDTTVRLCNEIDVYGTRALSSSFYDVGMACVQLPLFALNPALRVEANRDRWWLSAVSNSSDFCLVNRYGHADDVGATQVLGVRPRFLIG